jgi:hypothetical protein
VIRSLKAGAELKHVLDTCSIGLTRWTMMISLHAGSMPQPVVAIRAARHSRRIDRDHARAAVAVAGAREPRRRHH